MRFDYVKVIDFPRHYPRERILPWLRVGLFSKEDEVYYLLGLVDSGSDITIITSEFASKLGISNIAAVPKGYESEVRGVGGGKIKVYFHKVGIKIHNGSNEEPIVYKTYVGFTGTTFPSSMPQQTAILGHMGFFNLLKVTFDRPQGCFYVNPSTR